MIEDITRREVLKRAGGGAIGVTLAGRSASAQSRDPLDRHIVGTEPGRADVARDAATEVYRVLDFGDIGQAVSGWYPAEALDGLRNRPDVRYIEEEGTWEAIDHTDGDQTLPWGIDRVDAEVVHHNGETGDGAAIAIIDTGINDDHLDLETNVKEGKAFVECGNRSCTGEPCLDTSNCNHLWSDDNDHGTHCAGIADAVDNSEGVVGVSTEATLHAVKVLDCHGCGYLSDVAAGIEWTADQGHEVGSMSLGGSESSTVKDACQYAYEEGVLLVAAAGNDGSCTDCVSYPAAYEEVMAISATSEDDSLASFSSTGPEIELAAPGEDVYSTVIGGYDTFSGTSMACPHVSGAGGQLMGNGYTNTEARDRLKSTAENIGLSDNEQGEGLLDVAAALDAEVDDSNTAPSCSIESPSDGDIVSETVTIQVDATDEEDSDDSLDVEVSIDGGSWETTSYNTDSGYYEYDWDTTAEDDGDHTLQARATDSDGATTESDQITVTVDNTDDDNAPTIDQFELTDDGNPSWTRYYVDWLVSDADGDLSSVTSEMLDSSEVLDSESSSVSGESASGTHYLESRGEASDIRLTVTDEAGNETSASKEI